MSTGRFLSLFQFKYSNTPEQICVFENAEWKTLSTEEYNKKFNTELVHGVLCDEKHSPIIKKLQRKISEQKSEVIEDEPAFKRFVEHPINYFSICHINATCGYGLLANQYIPANTIIGVYSGELIIRTGQESEEPASNRRYDMGMGDCKNLSIVNENFEKQTYRLNLRADQQGDLTRFALHAPYRAEITNLRMNHELTSLMHVFTANVKFHQVIYRSTPIHYYKTTQAINKNSLIFINYGPNYFSARMIGAGNKPGLFARDDRNKLWFLNYSKGAYSLSEQIRLPQAHDEKPYALPPIIRPIVTRPIPHYPAFVRELPPRVLPAVKRTVVETEKQKKDAVISFKKPRY